MRKGDAEIKQTLDRLRVLADDPEKLLGVIDGLEALLLAKGDDYSGEENVFSNFAFASSFAALAVNVVFKTILSIKLGRLFRLIDSDKEVHFESMWLNVRDLLGYLVLWLALKKLEDGDAVYTDSAD